MKPSQTHYLGDVGLSQHEHYKHSLIRDKAVICMNSQSILIHGTAWYVGEVLNSLWGVAYM